MMGKLLLLFGVFGWIWILVVNVVATIVEQLRKENPNGRLSLLGNARQLMRGCLVQDFVQ